VQGRGAVEEHRVFLHHLVKNLENLRRLRLDKHLRLLDVIDHILVHEFLHNERLEEFQRHLGGKPALPHLEVGPHGDDAAA